MKTYWGLAHLKSEALMNWYLRVPRKYALFAGRVSEFTDFPAPRGEIPMKAVATNRSGRKLNVLLWVLQVLLAMLFMFAGAMKFVMPVAEMTKQIPFPGWFLHFIGGAEILGALGLVLPGILRIRTGLTPLAAAALVVIMIGATAVNVKTGQRGAALITVVLALLLVYVAYNRRRIAPHAQLSQGTSL
jgi:uncharacterized membrane protein YphA (DoxX/SURF4 family)